MILRGLYIASAVCGVTISSVRGGGSPFCRTNPQGMTGEQDWPVIQGSGQFCLVCDSMCRDKPVFYGGCRLSVVGLTALTQSSNTRLSATTFSSASEGDADSRLCVILSYAILLGGMCSIAVAVYTMVVSYSSLP